VENHLAYFRGKYVFELITYSKFPPLKMKYDFQQTRLPFLFSTFSHVDVSRSCATVGGQFERLLCF